MDNEQEIKVVTESERKAVEAALLEKFQTERPLKDGAAGCSPYSPEAVVYGLEGAKNRGARISVVPVCKSHDGAGSYKGKGRWRTVYAVAEKENGEYATCAAGDRDASEIGASGFYVLPWVVHEAEMASKGMGLGASALADAFSALGL